MELRKSAAMAGKGQGRMKTLDFVYASLAAALLAVSAWISIPTAVPFTLQTFAVCLAAGLLGMKRGTLALVIYLLVGIIGVPVFSGFRGGLGVLFGTTGGYIVGFFFVTLIVGGMAERFGRKMPVLLVSMLIGMAGCYAFGTAWYLFLSMRHTGPVGIGAVLGICVFPFIIPDLIKIVLASLLTCRLIRFVK